MHDQISKFIAETQDTHWWYSGRRSIVDSFLKMHLPALNGNRVLDFGAGFGGMTSVLVPIGTVDAYEPNLTAFEQLRRRGVRRVLSDEDYRDPANLSEYDLIAMFDVLEHIEDDVAELRFLAMNHLSPGGHVLITVPAYQWLWTSHDTMNDHFRRYTKMRLRRVVADADLHEVASSYFLTVLFPLAVVARFSAKLSGVSSTVGAGVGPLNPLLEMLFASEAPLVARGLVPFGLSIIMIARRRA